MNAALPPLRVDPGWYWWLVMPQDRQAYAAFAAANKGKVIVRKLMRGQSETNEVIVIEVREPVAWTLATPPKRAPKGIRTELSDLVQGPQPDPHWTVALEEILGAPVRMVREAGSALSLLVWGGAALLLFNLFRNTAPRRSDEPATEDA